MSATIARDARKALEGRAPQALAPARSLRRRLHLSSLAADCRRRPRELRAGRPSSSPGSITASCASWPSVSGLGPARRRCSPSWASTRGPGPLQESRPTSRGRCTCSRCRRGDRARPGHHGVLRLRLQGADRDRVAPHSCSRFFAALLRAGRRCCACGWWTTLYKARRARAPRRHGRRRRRRRHLAHRRPLPRAARLRAGHRTRAAGQAPQRLRRRAGAAARRSRPPSRRRARSCSSPAPSATRRPSTSSPPRTRAAARCTSPAASSARWTPRACSCGCSRCRSCACAGVPRADARPAARSSAPSTSSRAAAALVVLAPAFAVIAVLIKRDSPGPVFYRQTRVGARGRTFEFLKFRSMTAGNDAGEHKDYVTRLIECGGEAPALQATRRSAPSTSGAAPSTSWRRTRASPASAASCASTRWTSCRSSGTSSAAT